MRRIWGWHHYYIRHFPRYYCKWFGIYLVDQIIQLPFGLVLKWSDGTRLEEALAMQVARAAGLPVPKVICYGDHPESPHAPLSILMTRIPGHEIGQVYEKLDDGEKETIRLEMKRYLEYIRQWSNPWSDTRICSVIGTAIRSVRVPLHYVGPCENEQEIHEYLISAAWEGGSDSKEAFMEAMSGAQAIQKIPHKIVFTHGDLKHHNIMVDGGHFTGFLDWESAGWYPDYWEFTTARSYLLENDWWYIFASELGGGKYLEEQECEKPLTNLTSGSYYW